MGAEWGIFGLMTVSVVLFTIFIAPIWIIMHYLSKRKMNKGLSQEELNQLNSLSAHADKMAARIATLEAILDAESPKWRSLHD